MDDAGAEPLARTEVASAVLGDDLYVIGGVRARDATGRAGTAARAVVTVPHDESAPGARFGGPWRSVRARGAYYGTSGGARAAAAPSGSACPRGASR